MYDFEEVRGAHEVLWNSVARKLERAGVEGVPAALDRSRSVHELWTDPGLLLSQCCGADLVGRYAGTLALVATPLYRAPGCDGCWYSSVVLVAEDSPATELSDLRDAVCVVNSHESHSGANALRALVAPLSRRGRFFSRIVTSGSHPASVATVVRGEADVAAIDCVTYACLDRYRPSRLEGTRRLCYTARAPGIPFVAGRERFESNPALAERAPGSFRGAGGPRRRRRGVHRRRGDPSAFRVRTDCRARTPRRGPGLPGATLSVAVDLIFRNVEYVVLTSWEPLSAGNAVRARAGLKPAPTRSSTVIVPRRRLLASSLKFQRYLSFILS